ncbi:MAG: hypothetical protein EOS72_02985 [Mesorhizobium sp.]|uniref:hypothetical protein n=1 Tax=Mesorhizobium sp. TaxID=1871066 RepID=UPI000FE6665B|nr:hypothetical protein [Mesorhizobium sp.]RWC91636.1 MAG: hypothetical protein EOS72_02985 [Mesorhizobium sp.]
MSIEVEYFLDDVVVSSRNPLRGALPLANEDGEFELFLDRETAEFLVSALVQFLNGGEGGDMPKVSIGRRSD